MSIVTILLIILVIMAVGSAPRWGYSTGWGWGPSGTLWVILIIVLLVYLLNRSGGINL